MPLEFINTAPHVWAAVIYTITAAHFSSKIMQNILIIISYNR